MNLDIGCTIDDASLLRALAEDIPDMALSVRERLRQLATKLEGRHPPLRNDMTLVPCAVVLDVNDLGELGWLYIPHADGKWVSAARLVPFSIEIVKHWKAEQA